MYQHLTKLLLAGGVAVALLALGTVSIHSPTWAQMAGGGPLSCAEGQGAFFSDTNTWECGDIIGPDKIVFLTSTTTDGTMTFGGHQPGGGVAGAIAECQRLADDTPLNGGLSIVPPGTYLPWISGPWVDPQGNTVIFSPATHFTRSPGPYVCPGGLCQTRDPTMSHVVAYNWDDLVDATINAPIALDERGLFSDDIFVPTNTDIDGFRRGDGRDGPEDCFGWSSASLERFSFGGGNNWQEVVVQWTRRQVRSACISPLSRIYCFQQ